MVFPITAFAVSLFLLFSLILMSKFKEQIRLEDKESYRYIFGGLAILAAATISQVYSGIGVFNSIPFISDPLFYKVMYWIGIITGASFLISGISQWLPLSRAHRKYNRERVRQFELLKKVEQLVHVENRQKHVLSKTIEYMVEHYDLLYGAVYGFQPETENMDLITSVGASDEIERYLGKMKFNINCLLKPEEENLSSLSRLIEPIPDKVTPPSMVLPLVIDNQVYSVFLLWLTADSEIDDEARVNLKIAIDIIARKIILDHHEVSHAFNQQREVWIDSIEKVIDYQKDLSENVVGIANCVMRMVPAELFSLTVMDSQRVVRQFSVGEARSVLNEVSHGLNSANSHVKRAFETGQPQYVEALDKMESQTRADEIINRSGMISLAAIPIEYKGNIRGVILVAGRQTGGYLDHDRRLLESICPIFCNLLTDDIYRNELSKRERRAMIISSFLNEAGRTGSLHEIFEREANVLSTELKCSLVRIATFDRDGAFLSSRALVLQSSAKPITPPDGHMILSLMPYHRLVRDTGRMMLINQQNTEKKMGFAETRQMFSEDLQSALIVPIKIGQHMLGVISIADTREWDQYRYRHADLSFISSMAAVLALAIQARLGVTAGSFVVEEQTDTNTGSGDLEFSMKSRIKSSLSGILGSVDLIRSQPRTGDETLEQYLSIIDKSARSIDECFAEER